MNNNNTYFSCFSLIRACVSSLFANFYKVVAVCLIVCFALCSPLAAFASTTESMMMFSLQQDDHAVQPLVLYDEESESLYANVRIGDLQLDKWPFYSGSFFCGDIPTNQRFSEDYFATKSIPNTSSANTYDKYLQVVYTFRNDTEGLGLFYPLIGLDFNAKGFYSNIRFEVNDTMFYTQFSILKPVDAYYRYSSSYSDLIGSGSINLNDIKINSDLSTSLSFTIPKDSTEQRYATDLSIYLTYEIPDSLYGYDVSSKNITYAVAGFYGNDNYVYSDFIRSGSSSSSSDSDYNKNVEAELGNIQTGINNVINSVVQMGNQAWQGAQQTVQAVTQMTQQLNTAIDQQRQDILNGLGLLGDDIGSSLTNVKTEITNIGSSITSKIESTTETITNTIENKVDEVTTAVEDVKQSVTEVKQSILDLPNKIKDMLLGLIVPDAETMGGKYSEFTELLEAKLGVIYQIPAMILELFETLVSGVTDPQTTLTFPSLSLPWIDGTQMKLWDSIEFEIIPTGMDVLKELIQTVTSMVCVIMTFNSVKRIYENFLRGR